MAAAELAVIVLLLGVVGGLGAYTIWLRMKLVKALHDKSARLRLARDPVVDKLDGPWMPSPAATAAWKLAFSLVSKSLKQQKYKRMMENQVEDDKEQFIEGIVHFMIDRAVDSCATHGGRLRHAGALAKALAKRRGLRRLKQLAEDRRTLRLQRRKGQLANVPHHLSTAGGQMRSVNVEFDGATDAFPDSRAGKAPRTTGPLTAPRAPPGAGPGQREAERRLSLNASGANPSAAGGEQDSLLRTAASASAPPVAVASVPGQLPDPEGPGGDDDDDEVPLAMRKKGKDIRPRGVIWLATQGMAPAAGSLVIAFGDHQRGQLGLDPATAARQVSRNTIITVEELRGCEPLQVEASGVASLVVGSRGQVWGFGSNRALELAQRKEIAQVQAPQRVKSLRANRAVQMSSSSAASGQAHTLLLAETGEVFTFGTSASGALGQGPDVRQSAPLLLRMSTQVPIRQVAAGAQHSLLVSDEGRLFTVGDNRHGQLGHGTRDPANAWTPKFVDTPGPVEGELREPSVRIRLIAAGDDHSLATTEDGRTFAWGANSNGQLGIGRVGDQAVPLAIRELQDASITSLACGSRHSLAVAGNGKQVWSFGSNVQGQLGLGQSSAAEGFQLNKPAIITPLSNQCLTEVVQVAAAGNHSLAVTRTGELWAWGDNAYGQLGFPREGHGHQMSHAISGAVQATRTIPPRVQHQARSRTALEVDAPRMFAEGVGRLHVPVRVVSLALYQVLAASTSDMHSLVLAA